MKIEVYRLKLNKKVTVYEEVNLDQENYQVSYPLMSIEKVNARADVTQYSEFIDVTLEVLADVTLSCSYSLENFPYKIHEKINLQFTQYDEDESEDVILLKENVINLDSYIFDLISVSVPSKPIKPGAKKPQDGKGYRIISEEDYLKEKENTNDPRFDKLSELDLD